jgi:hypothetical protein
LAISSSRAFFLFFFAGFSRSHLISSLIFSNRSQFDHSNFALRKLRHRRYRKPAESSRLDKCLVATKRGFSNCSLKLAATLGLSDDQALLTTSLFPRLLFFMLVASCSVLQLALCVFRTCFQVLEKFGFKFVCRKTQQARNGLRKTRPVKPHGQGWGSY